MRTSRVTQILALLAICFVPTLSRCQAPTLPRSHAPTPPPSVEGRWKWKFKMPDGSEVTPKLTLKRKDGAIIGTTRFRAGSETSVTNLTFDGTNLAFEVVRERNGTQTSTRYAGVLRGDIIKGKIVSNWGGEEQSYPWEARRSNDVEGTWKWTTTFGEFRSESTVKLKQDGEKVSGKVSSRRGTDLEVKKGKFKSGKVSFEVERDREGEKSITKYSGMLSGDKIIGTIESEFAGNPRTNQWEAVLVD